MSNYASLSPVHTHEDQNGGTCIYVSVPGALCGVCLPILQGSSHIPSHPLYPLFVPFRNYIAFQTPSLRPVLLILV